MKKLTGEKLNAFITEELIANQQVKVTFQQTGMNRSELSQFIDSFLTACSKYYTGGNVYADPTLDGVIVYEY